jgi:eukaryotic-like serine/threonine-protein kinase
MKPEQSLEESLFQAAATLTGTVRAAFLDRACGGDGAMRARLEALLKAHDQSGELLPTQCEPEQAAARAEQLADSAEATAGQMLGRYKILEKIGEGGYGAVYVAEQTEPVRRRVALKVIKLGMDTKAVVARFEAERQALALMDHPNIAKVLDAGSTENGRPYFVMELVRGIRITDYCDQSQLSTPERLDLFVKVCHAIQHAHQKGIIHRDIKPSNILVTLHDGVPVPKVIDFGIAKATEGRLTEATIYTQLHQFIGTPAYMSPEQAEMSGLDIDTRSDVYSLGVLLYEMLTGKTPFDGRELMEQGLEEMRRTIREKEPARPSTRLATLQGEELTTAAKRRSVEGAKLIHLVRGDLDWIVMKCLEKDRARRYETANALAEDLERHRNHEPVLARPPSAAYRFQKAFRRNKFAFAAAAALVSALVLGVVASSWQAFRARRAERAQAILRHAAETSRQIALAESAKNERVATLMMDMVKTFNPMYWLERGPEGWDEPLDAMTQRALEALTDKPELELDFCVLLAGIHHELGSLQESRDGVKYRTGAALSRIHWPENSWTNLNHFHRLAELSRRAFHLTEKKHTGDHPALAESLAVFGDALRHVGELPEAESRLTAALTMRQRLFGPNHFLVGQTLYQLAIVQKLLGNHATADANFRASVSVLGDHYSSPNGSLLARAYVGLAKAVWNRGAAAGIEPVLQSARDIHHRDQQSVAARSENQSAGRRVVAVQVNPLGDLASVIQVPVKDLYEEAFAIEIETLGSNHEAVKYLRKMAEFAASRTAPSRAPAASTNSMRKIPSRSAAGSDGGGAAPPNLPPP